MAWQDHSVILLRSLIGDDVSPYTYSDSRLQDFLVSAAFFLVSTIDFSTSYTVNVTTSVITPDPYDSGDVAFMNLLALRANAMVANSEYKTATLKAVSFKDGPSSYDGRAVAEEKGKIAKSAEAAYKQAEKEYRAGNNTPGEAIVSPHRVSDYNTYYGRFN